MLLALNILIIQYINKPKGPIKYVITSGIIKIILFIENFCESFTIQPPVKRLIEIKCIQKIIRKDLSENKLDKFSILR